MRAKLHGLFVFGKISGLVISIQIMTGIDISETGILENVLEVLSNSFGEIDPLVVTITAVIIPGMNFLTVFHHVKTAVEHRGRGIAVSCGGFFGMLALILGGMGGATGIAFLGVIGLIVSIFIVNYKLN